MSAQRLPTITEAEYLQQERQAEVKSEYHAGRIYAMAGASTEHTTITFNVIVAIGLQLRGKSCRGLSNDMRIKAPDSRFYTYPDLSVACGELILEDEHGDTLLNPTLLVEVLSPSTERYDRGAKFAHYQRIESLKEYVLISQDRPRVEHYVKQADGSWNYTAADGLAESINLPSIECSLDLSAVYENVEFAVEAMTPMEETA